MLALERVLLVAARAASANAHILNLGIRGGGFAGFLLGIPALRLRGLYLALLTLGLAITALLVSVVNSTLWFAVTFWVYLETRSVVAAGA